jgi:hypothetical protein
MTCLVVGCNQWIGFHVVNELLENDIQVDGIESEQGNAILSLFFGRNSLFSFVSADVKKHYDTIIFTDELQVLPHAQADCMLRMISDDAHLGNMQADLCIYTPILFGEWMPMEHDGFYYQQQFITFDSNRMKTSGVYIEDFTKGLLQWMKIKHLPTDLIVKSIREKGVKEKNLKDAIYLRDKSPISDNIKKVREHFDRYKASY